MNRNLTAFILIVIAVGIYVTVTQGIIASAQQVKTVNDQYVTAIANAARLVAARDQVLKDYNAISDNDRARLDKMIPDTVDNIRLIIDLNGIAASRHMSFKSVTAAASGASSAGSPASAAPNPATTAMNAPMGGGVASSQHISAPALDTVTVSFSVSADYQDFINLLQAMEADLRIMDLTHLSVTANDTGTYDWSLQFKTYWIRQTT